MKIRSKFLIKMYFKCCVKETTGNEMCSLCTFIYFVQVAKLCTLVSLIIVQDGINVQAGKILKINKCAGWNKAVQDGIFHFSLMKIHIQAQNFPNLINVQDKAGIRSGCCNPSYWEAGV